MTGLAPGQERSPAERAGSGGSPAKRAGSGGSPAERAGSGGSPAERAGPGRAKKRNPGEQAGPAPAGEVLAAMADPTRRQILAELAGRGPATATELASGLPITRQAVGKHLAALSQAGLVVSSKHGRDVRFEVRTENLAETADWLAGLAAEWDIRLTAIKRIAESGA